MNNRLIIFNGLIYYVTDGTFLLNNFHGTIYRKFTNGKWLNSENSIKKTVHAVHDKRKVTIRAQFEIRTQYCIKNLN
jgi:hypothetical protein